MPPDFKRRRETLKISEITLADVAAYLRLERGDYVEAELTAIMEASRRYISSYTGIPAASGVEGVETLDDHADFYIAYMVLCQDAHDNRTMYPDGKFTNSANRVVESILGMHARNLL